jgi:transcriptional regulator with XRE-family HTH domain
VNHARQKPPQHNVTRLRLLLGKSQREMADIIGCSFHTIQSLERQKEKRLKLSEDLARRISATTGVNLRWLLDNDDKAPIVRAGFGRTWPYTLSDFEHRQAMRAHGDSELSRQVMADYAASFYGQIRALLSAAAKRDLGELAVWKIGKFLNDCRSEFGNDDALVSTDDQFGLRADDSLGLKLRKIEAGITLFRKYDRERTASIRRTLKELNKGKWRLVTDMGSVQIVIEGGRKGNEKKSTPSRR